MATYTTYPDGRSITASSGYNAAGAPAVTVITGEFDASLRTLAAADVVTLLDIPARTFVHKVFYQVLTADATQTLNIGDGSDVDGFVAVADVATVGNTGMGAGAYSAGKFYTAADTIDLEVPTGKALDTLKIRVSATVTLLA